jgi:hypothetical protein
MLNMKKLLIMLAILLLPSLANGEFLLTHETRIGGSSITSDEYEILKKYDFVWLGKFHADDQNFGDTFAGLRASNADIIIYVYGQHHICHDEAVHDAQFIVGCNNLCRGGNYESTLPDTKEANPGGDIFNDNPDYQLHSGDGSQCSTSGSGAYRTASGTTRALMNFGTCTDAINFVKDATIYDFCTYPDANSELWHTADGIYFDNMIRQKDGYSNVPWSADDWDTYQDDFIKTMVDALAASACTLEFGVNRGGLYQSDAFVTSWETSDNHDSPPSAVMEEGAFVTYYPTADTQVQFYSETAWLRQAKALHDTDNSKAIFQSTCDYAYNSSGTDNYGDTTYGYDCLWYGMGSFLLARNGPRNNDYFSYHWEGTNATNNTNNVTWYDEFDAARGGNLDLGGDMDQLDVDDATRTVEAGTIIYFREFQDGYVYVNPTGTNSTTITLPETCKEITKDDLTADVSTLSNVTTFTLNRHRAKFFRKADEPVSATGNSATGNCFIDTGGSSGGKMIIHP